MVGTLSSVILSIKNKRLVTTKEAQTELDKIKLTRGDGNISWALIQIRRIFDDIVATSHDKRRVYACRGRWRPTCDLSMSKVILTSDLSDGSIASFMFCFWRHWITLPLLDGAIRGGYWFNPSRSVESDPTRLPVAPCSQEHTSSTLQTDKLLPSFKFCSQLSVANRCLKSTAWAYWRPHRASVYWMQHRAQMVLKLF